MLISIILVCVRKNTTVSSGNITGEPYYLVYDSINNKRVKKPEEKNSFPCVHTEYQRFFCLAAIFSLATKTRAKGRGFGTGICNNGKIKPAEKYFNNHTSFLSKQI
ncbi:hypothetical protein HHI36_018971 [Cryptolaemus montrouzieri]|uniref:Uncharacterized protein n=1 Tax=Cryptolaemus montrouzieri TaxID=559131 RepID=A0ABD2P2C6_9CUCU